MLVKNRLRINSAVSALLTLVILTVLFLTIHRVSTALEAAKIADEIMTTSFERLMLRIENQRTGSERSKVQLFARHNQSGELLMIAEEKLRGTKDNKTIEELRSLHDSIGYFLRAIRENREKAGPGVPLDELSQEIEDRLLSQLDMNAYENILLCTTLQESSRQAVISALKVGVGRIIAVLLLVTAAIQINSSTMGRAIGGRIKRLQDGAAVIGAGGLDHRIDIQGDDEFAGLAESFNDMTEKLNDSYRELRNEIGERKRAEEGLRLAKDTAEAASRAKSQFLANMSHELRTPMNSFLGVLQLLLGNHAGPLEPKQRELLAVADKSAHCLLQVISDILDLSKIEAGKLSITEKPFHLRACFSEAIELFSADAQQKELDLSFTVAPDVPDNVVGDFLRLRQVLINLVGNAIKFTDRGSVAVKSAAGSQLPGGKRECTFTVTDTGIGIPEDKKHLLFSPFSQADDSDTRSYGGTGLGLAISRQIVEMMGGTISFESTEGVGSTFSFTVPLGEGVEEAGTMPEAPAPVAVAPPPVTGAEKKPLILVAEDDIMASDLLMNILELSGLEANLARTGREAVDMWEKHRYDLIIMDIQMPRLDGISATRIIREKEKTTGGHIPIVAMTAHAFREDEERCYAAGMDAYLTKPLDLKTGMEVIMNRLQK